jgi:hypothetical protein
MRTPTPVAADPALEWALARCLLIRVDWASWQIPREVALALRGEDWRPVLSQPPPPVPYVDAPPELVARAEAAGAAAAVQAASAVLDACAAAPLPALRTGGVGVRELRRLAKLVGLPEDEVAFWIDLGAAAGLLREDTVEVLPTETYDAWRAREPADRLSPLALAWRTLRCAPTHRRDVAGKAVPALAPPSVNRAEVAAVLREAVLTAAGERPGEAVADPEALVARAVWERPLAYPVDESVSRPRTPSPRGPAPCCRARCGRPRSRRT